MGREARSKKTIRSSILPICWKLRIPWHEIDEVKPCATAARLSDIVVDLIPINVD